MKARRIGRLPYPPGKDHVVAWVPVLRGTGGLFHWGQCKLEMFLKPGRWHDTSPESYFYGFADLGEALRRAAMHPMGEVRKAKFQKDLALGEAHLGGRLVVGERMLLSRNVYGKGEKE